MKKKPASVIEHEVKRQETGLQFFNDRDAAAPNYLRAQVTTIDEVLPVREPKNPNVSRDEFEETISIHTDGLAGC